MRSRHRACPARLAGCAQLPSCPPALVPCLPPANKIKRKEKKQEIRVTCMSPKSPLLWRLETLPWWVKGTCPQSITFSISVAQSSAGRRAGAVAGEDGEAGSAGQAAAALALPVAPQLPGTRRAAQGRAGQRQQVCKEAHRVCRATCRQSPASRGRPALAGCGCRWCRALREIEPPMGAEGGGPAGAEGSDK